MRTTNRFEVIFAMVCGVSVRRLLVISIVATVDVGASSIRADEETAAKVNYNRDVRPILAENCFRCHGPDANERQANLRLDHAEEVFAETDSGVQAIVPAQPDESELVRRIESPDEWEQMPPPDSGKTLSEQQKATLRQWIAEGAPYEKHWSFLPPERPAVPDVGGSSWPRNEIDSFILRRLSAANLEPSPEADRRTLLRRLSFDLTGLPPTLSEVEAFVADESADAYERQVDRLLASPRYGERMAIDWLDLARYADTDGYEKDSFRQMWPYRDWVIDAFNHNMPFDQFTLEQLAGDLLPAPAFEQQIASAFNRNGPTTSESGSDPDEYAVKYAVDRVSTTATTWLGLTMQCAECHDHKFDPLTAKDFYSMVAFFDQVPEQPLYEGADSPPSIPAYSPEQAQRAADYQQRIGSIEQYLQSAEAGLRARQPAWEADHGTTPEPDAGGEMVRLARCSFEDDEVGGGEAGQAVVRVSPRGGPPQFVDGVQGSAGQFAGNGAVECVAGEGLTVARGFSIAAWINASAGGGIAFYGGSDSADAAVELSLANTAATVRFADRRHGRIFSAATAPLPVDRWIHVLVACGGEHPDMVRVYVDGVRQPAAVQSSPDLAANLASSTPQAVGSPELSGTGLNGSIDEVELFGRGFTDAEAGQVAQTAIRRTLQIPAAQRTVGQTQAIETFYRLSIVEPLTSRVRAELEEQRQEFELLRSTAPMVRIMADVPERRPTFIRVRGDFRSLGDQVAPAVPTALGELPAGDPQNRLGLARWLVGDDNPLTARVEVNRLWAMCFGTGIVKTLNDFGSQGEWPSHPDLLDWLAVEFRASGWDVQHILRLIVTSSTYRQSSACTHKLLELDPQNRLLSRGPRHRLPAEMLRDNALAVSGLLHERLGGPSVFPYHPAGLWEDMAWADAPHKTWIRDSGPNLHRRGLYTFWKRGLIHPALSLFDAPNRNVCEFARPTTNTPLQSFVTLNEPSFVEAAQALARRAMNDADGVNGTIDRLFELALMRSPNEPEAQALETLYGQVHERFTAAPAEAAAFAQFGESSVPEGVDTVDVATWTIIAQAVLNVDESLTKE